MTREMVNWIPNRTIGGMSAPRVARQRVLGHDSGAVIHWAQMATVQPATSEVDQKDIDEARAFNAQLEALIATQPPVNTLPPEVSRQARREGRGIFPPPIFLEDARDIEIAGRGGPIKVRLVRPDHRPIGIYLHIHGGGWTLGAHDMQDAALKLFADETGLCAASIGYRLPPEDPPPPGPHDLR